MSPPPREPGTLSPGELARRSGVNIETIRYYERVGMLPAPPRTVGGRRVYGPAAARRLAFIRRSRELGLGLAQIRALLASARCAEARALAADHLALIRAKIADLQAMERVIADAVERCAGGEDQHCPVIDALSSPAP
jgi:MerR family mercuric resistance operon transcriptional regulator